jgi:hypothetical protein
LGKKKTGIFFSAGLDTMSSGTPAGQISKQLLGVKHAFSVHFLVLRDLSTSRPCVRRDDLLRAYEATTTAAQCSPPVTCNGSLFLHGDPCPGTNAPAADLLLFER